MDNTFRERFRNATPQQLVDALNSQVGNPGWVTARGFYLAALRDAFLATGLDCSSFIIKGGTLLVCRVRLDGDKIVPIAEAPKPPLKIEAPTPTHELTDSTKVIDLPDQPLIDALIRSMKWGNEAKIQEFGEELVARWGGAQGAGEDGILRRFDELEDTNFVVELLDLSPERAEELEEGGRLTRKEADSLADAVEER